MGSKATQPRNQPSLDDLLLQMRINAKRMNKQSVKALKDSQNYMKKAKEALRKNNEEAAKLYLKTASSKKEQAINIQRMGMKMEFIARHMKGMENNQNVMNSFQRMTTVAGYNTPNFQAMTKNIGNFQKCMDDILINGKIMEQMMEQNMDTENATTDHMLADLKEELAMDAKIQVMEAAIMKEKEMNGLLKGVKN